MQFLISRAESNIWLFALFSVFAILIRLWHDTVSKRQIIASAMIMNQYFDLIVLILMESSGFLVEEKSDC